MSIVLVVFPFVLSDVIMYVIRYQEEEREKMEALEKLRCEEEQRRRKEIMEEEVELRDKLMKNVQQLEQRKREIERELKLRTSSSQRSQLKSAIIVPRTEYK